MKQHWIVVSWLEGEEHDRAIYTNGDGRYIRHATYAEARAAMLEHCSNNVELLECRQRVFQVVSVLG